MMSWQPVDFQSILDIDQKLADRLDQYLQAKETALANKLKTIFYTHAVKQGVAHPSLPIRENPTFKLSDAIDSINSLISNLKANPSALCSLDQLQKTVKEVNRVLWEFAEIIEESEVELFQQVKQITLDKWTDNLADVLYSIKERLSHYLEDLIWTVQKLQAPITEYQHHCEDENFFKRWFGWGHYQIDSVLISHLKQSSKYLQSHYEMFRKHFSEFRRLNIEIDKYMKALDGFSILANLDQNQSRVYVNLYVLLKMYELNPNKKDFIAQETIRALRTLANLEGMDHTFLHYYNKFENTLFKSSLELKELSNTVAGNLLAIKKIQLRTIDIQNELQVFAGTLSKYRDFMLKTDPNPYVRSRWGFSEWIVGPEPDKAKETLSLIYNVQNLQQLYAHFLHSLRQGSDEQNKAEAAAHEEIETLLHEMSQPLISERFSNKYVQKLLDEIKRCDELGSASTETVNFLQNVLLKAMREDWKYQTLQNYSSFHDLFKIHHELNKGDQDSAHQTRLDKLRHLFNHIGNWLQQGGYEAHSHEIDLDINDIKIYLQDFLATIQRQIQGKKQEDFKKFREQLLDYRYLFGQFLHPILQKEFQKRYLRNRFLFVDQYFETCENLLREEN